MAKIPPRGAVLSLSALFRLSSEFSPSGDQPRAIGRLIELLVERRPHSVLLGITGSGKTFTLANVIAGLGRPALVISPNKTLAAQLYGEFKSYFPENAVEYFVSYYDYYQPEAYVPQTDTYIAKDSSINETIDKMRHSATRSLLERRDVVIVASVSCIYGLGSPENYQEMLLQLKTGQAVPRIRKLVKNNRHMLGRQRQGGRRAWWSPRPRRAGSQGGSGAVVAGTGDPDRGQAGGRKGLDQGLKGRKFLEKLVA